MMWPHEATLGYMKKFVGVRELKDKLSSYVRAARRGKTIIITDRGEPVAELRPLSSASSDDRLQELIARGLIIPPEDPNAEIPKMSGTISLPEGTAQRLIDEDRGE